MPPIDDAFFDSPERFQELFAQAPVGLFTFDLEHRMRDFNAAFVDIMKSSAERLRGLDIRTLRDQRPVPALLAALKGEEGRYLGPYDATTAQSHIIVFLHSRPMLAADGSVRGALCLLEDATERIRLENNLRTQLAVVQQQATTIRSLGTPILQVWPQVLCLPVIGDVDHARAAEMTETMLAAIVSHGARFVIVDLTGVPVADTATAEHFVRLFRAASLLGAETLLCGIQPTVAQAIIGLGVDLQMRTMRTLHKALEHCLRARPVAPPGARAEGAGTDASFEAPPGQNPASVFPAQGSHLWTTGQ